MPEEIKSWQTSGSACYYSIQNPSSLPSLPKKGKKYYLARCFLWVRKFVYHIKGVRERNSRNVLEPKMEQITG